VIIASGLYIASRERLRRERAWPDTAWRRRAPQAPVRPALLRQPARARGAYVPATRCPNAGVRVPLLHRKIWRRAGRSQAGPDVPQLAPATGGERL